MRSIALLLLLALPSRAELMPSFWLDSLAWRATEIVVASEGETIDGKLVVVDRLVGDVKVQSTIELPGLAKFADKNPGASMVLFLIHGVSGFRGAAQYGGIEVSAAWIVNDDAFALVQIINPGPRVMTKVATKSAMLARIAGIREERNRFEAARTLDGAVERAAALARLIDSPIPVARGDAVVALGDCGPNAMPVIERLLADPARSPYHAMLIAQLARAGGAEAAPKLARQLERDLHYWIETGPTLPNGWWNGTEVEPKWRALLQQNYVRTLETLRALQKLQYREAAPTAKRLAEFWRSLPQLHDKSGLDQMTEAAEAVAKLED